MSEKVTSKLYKIEVSYTYASMGDYLPVEWHREVKPTGRWRLVITDNDIELFLEVSYEIYTRSRWLSKKKTTTKTEYVSEKRLLLVNKKVIDFDCNEGLI